LVYLPKGVWCDYWTGKRYEGGRTIPVRAPLEIVPLFVRAGAIIPTTLPMKYVGEQRWDPLTLAIYPDEKGSASASLYEDDGLSPAYTDGMFRRTEIQVTSAGKDFRLKTSSTGKYNPGSRKLHFILSQQDRIIAVPNAATDSGEALDLVIK
jgi:alpha-glucosidase